MFLDGCDSAVLGITGIDGLGYAVVERIVLHQQVERFGTVYPSLDFFFQLGACCLYVCITSVDCYGHLL